MANPTYEKCCKSSLYILIKLFSLDSFFQQTIRFFVSIPNKCHQTVSLLDQQDIHVFYDLSNQHKQYLDWNEKSKKKKKLREKKFNKTKKQTQNPNSNRHNRCRLARKYQSVNALLAQSQDVSHEQMQPWARI